MRTPTQRLNRIRFQQEWTVIAAVRSFAVLRDHGLHRDVLITPAFFQSLRLIVERFVNFPRFPPTATPL